MAGPGPIIVAIKVKFVLYCAALVLVNTARATKTALGARPEYPVDMSLDTDYTTVTTAIATYDAAMDTANAALLTAVNNLYIAANNLFTLSTGGVVTPSMQWIELVALVSGDFLPYADTVYIGFDNRRLVNRVVLAPGSPTTNIPELVVIETAPLNEFPDQTPA